MTGASTDTIVNGGTGSYALEATAVLLVVVVGLPLTAWLTSTVQRALAYRAAKRRWEQLVARGEHRRLVIVPDQCRACGGSGWHDQDCRLLDARAVQP